MADTDAPGGKKTNVLTRKIGPLPMWAWTSIVLIIVVGYALLQNRKQQAAQAATGTGTDASQVPQFVNQTYTTVLPPAAPGTTHPGSPAEDNDRDERHPRRNDRDADDRRREPPGRRKVQGGGGAGPPDRDRNRPPRHPRSPLPVPERP